MKKVIAYLLVAAIAAASASCGPGRTTPSKNIVMQSELTAEQQEILDLLSIPNNHEVLLFDFNADEAFSRVEVWVEAYEYGRLVERPAGLSTVIDIGESRSGRLAVIISQNDSTFQWTISAVESSMKASHTGTAEVPSGQRLGRAYGPMDDPADIEQGKEIIIYTSTFQDAGVPHIAYDALTLQERPELLIEYPYAHLIKCAFS